MINLSCSGQYRLKIEFNCSEGFKKLERDSLSSALRARNMSQKHMLGWSNLEICHTEESNFIAKWGAWKSMLLMETS